MGNAPMSKSLLYRVLVKSGDDENPVFIKFLLIVQKELVHGTSLVREERRGKSDVYNMHRLVRLFVLVDLEVRSNEWNAAFEKASISVHECVGHHLQRESKSFDSLNESDVFNVRRHRKWVSHALAIVHHCRRCYLSGNEVFDLILITQIHQYNGVVLDFFGRYEEEKVWEGILRILKQHHGDLNLPNIANALGNLGYVCES